MTRRKDQNSNMVKTFKELVQELEKHFEESKEWVWSFKGRENFVEKNGQGKNYIGSHLEMHDVINDLHEKNETTPYSLQWDVLRHLAEAKPLRLMSKSNYYQCQNS